MPRGAAFHVTCVFPNFSLVRTKSHCEYPFPICRQSLHWSSPGCDGYPSNMACRIIFWFGYVVSVMVYTSYSATLVSHLAVEKPAALPFTNLLGLSQQTDWDAGCNKNDLFQVTASVTRGVFRCGSEYLSVVCCLLRISSAPFALLPEFVFFIDNKLCFARLVGIYPVKLSTYVWTKSQQGEQMVQERCAVHR